mgnify:CR=1 FL=1
MINHKHCLVGMHDTSYDTPITISLSIQIICASLCEFSFVCFRSGEKFQTFWSRGVATSVGLVGILITGNLDGVRTSSKLMCARGVLSRPHGKKLVKFGTSFDDRPFQTRASHMKDHGFQKETCQFKLLWPVTSSFGLIKISTVRNHHYTTGFYFLVHFTYR